MAKFVATDTVYLTVGEIIQYVAVTSGLVSTGTDKPDEVYEHLKLFAREQKGKDFRLLDAILDELQQRLEECIAPPGLGDITFDVFRRFLSRYKVLILHGRANAWAREQFVEEILIPEFIVPHAAWLLKRLNQKPFDVLSINELLRSTAPLKVAFTYFLSFSGKSWLDLAELYQGKAASYGGKAAEHDVEDNKKLIRKWGAGKATPSFETCLDLLKVLGQDEYSGIVFWIWIARFLQKIDLRYRLLIADAIQRAADIPSPKDFAKRLTDDSDARSRRMISQETVLHFRILTTLLFYNTHRHQGDKARVEQLLTKVKGFVEESPHTRYYVTWLEARYHLYCRDMQKALAGYEQAFYEGMYRDCQAENGILPEWAAIAQKAGDKAAIKRIDSRMKMLGMYPTYMSTDEVAAMRMRAFHDNLGAGLCFHESFADGCK
jgi:hypothetical protein